MNVVEQHKEIMISAGIKHVVDDVYKVYLYDVLDNHDAANIHYRCLSVCGWKLKSFHTMTPNYLWRYASPIALPYSSGSFQNNVTSMFMNAIAIDSQEGCESLKTAFWNLRDQCSMCRLLRPLSET